MRHIRLDFVEKSTAQLCYPVHSFILTFLQLVVITNLVRFTHYIPTLETVAGVTKYYIPRPLVMIFVSIVSCKVK